MYLCALFVSFVVVAFSNSGVVGGGFAAAAAGALSQLSDYTRCRIEPISTRVMRAESIGVYGGIPFRLATDVSMCEGDEGESSFTFSMGRNSNSNASTSDAYNTTNNDYSDTISISFATAAVLVSGREGQPITLKLPTYGTATFLVSDVLPDGSRTISTRLAWRDIETYTIVLCGTQAPLAGGGSVGRNSVVSVSPVSLGAPVECSPLDDSMALLLFIFWVCPALACGVFLAFAWFNKHDLNLQALFTKQRVDKSVAPGARWDEASSSPSEPQTQPQPPI